MVLSPSLRSSIGPFFMEYKCNMHPYASARSDADLRRSARSLSSNAAKEIDWNSVGGEEKKREMTDGVTSRDRDARRGRKR